MLARLQDIACIDRAEVDRAGTYLRITVPDDATLDQCLAAAVALLDAEGVYVEPTPAGLPTDTRWFGPDDVGDLSRVEAERIGSDVAAALAARLDQPQAMPKIP